MCFLSYFNYIFISLVTHKISAWRNSGVFKTLGSKLIATRCRLIEVRVFLSVTKSATQEIDDFIATKIRYFIGLSRFWGVNNMLITIDGLYMDISASM